MAVSTEYSHHIMYVRIHTRERAMRYIHTWLADGYTGSWLYSKLAMDEVEISYIGL